MTMMCDCQGTSSFGEDEDECCPDCPKRRRHTHDRLDDEQEEACLWIDIPVTHE